MILLEDILNLPRFSDLTLLTDQRTIEGKIVKTAEVSEAPDIEHFISPHTLLVSTLFAFKADPLDIIPYIDSLIRAQACGLGIKLNRFLGGKLDQEIIDYANQVNFPIFFIPDKYTLGGLMHQIMNIINDTAFEEIEYALDIQKTFSHLLINGATNQELVDKLSSLANLPIILLNPYKEIIAQSSQFDDNPALANFYITELTRRQALSHRTEGNFVLTDENNETKPVSVVKIHVFNHFPHYLIIADPELISYPLSVFAFEQASLVFTFNLYKNRKVMESKYTNETYFFNHIVNRFASAQDLSKQLAELSRHYNYINTNFYKIIHITVWEAVEDDSLSDLTIEKLYLIFLWLRTHIRKSFPSALVFWKGESYDIIILIQEQDNQLEEKLLSFKEKLDCLFSADILYSVSQTVKDQKHIQEAIIEAELVLSERRTHHLTEPIIFYENKGAEQLFNSVDYDEIQYFCQSMLKDLIADDSETTADLRHTLKVYLDNQCEITKTASDLYVHRNTVKYRIEKCENILGLTVHTPENSLNLRLALNLFEKYLH